MSDEAVEVRICGAKAGSRVYALFLGNERHTFVMHLDRAAFAGISSALKGEESPRPGTHQLMRNLLLGLDATLEHALIHAVKDGVFYARIRVSMRNEVARKIVEIDARASDAIALALLMRKPVLCARSVMRATPDMTDVLKRLQRKGD